MGHKTRLGKFSKIIIIQCLFYDHVGINSKSITEKPGTSLNMWKLNNIPLNNPWDRGGSLEGNFEKIQRTRENKNTIYQNI